MYTIQIARRMSITKLIGVSILAILLLWAPTVSAENGVPPQPVPKSSDLDVKSASVRLDRSIDAFVFELKVDGEAGRIVPQARGQLDGAPLLAYVFVTDLKPQAVGFGPVEDGILALAVTVHPDFDDTPLWDENGDGAYDNDGYIYHTHWVVLVPDQRVEGGLSVFQFEENDPTAILPPTNPGMPLYLDSPGHPVNLNAERLQVIVPRYRLRGTTAFSYDVVSAYLQVNKSDDTRPMLGVYKVYDVLSGDLSLPYRTVTP